MGKSANQPFQLSFNASLKIEFQGSHVTSDDGLIQVRGLDERLGFGKLIDQHLTDFRREKNTQFPFADLLGQSVYSRLEGYEDLNDWAARRRAGVWSATLWLRTSRWAYTGVAQEAKMEILAESMPRIVRGIYYDV